MQTKKQKQEKALKNLESEFSVLHAQREKIVKNNHSNGYGWYVPESNDLARIRNEISNLKLKLGIK